ncbi:pyridine nucleotide-disulfide oxidoreductase, dimerization domain protein [Bordetella pertussis STO1-SEAT-0006]|nr:pyridine nucleotide-disulfide oxidoreductase, dimerization domain protein [Bordetella pertussis STO1-SEAT-0006]
MRRRTAGPSACISMARCGSTGRRSWRASRASATASSASCSRAWRTSRPRTSCAAWRALSKTRCCAWMDTPRCAPAAWSSPAARGPRLPPPFLALGDRLVVNDDVFAWDTLPARVAVFGPGVIGLELGQALARLGVQVRVFGVSGSLGGITDPRVRQSARKAFQQEFYLDPDARVLETKRVGDEVEVRYVALDNTERTERFDYALVATGRRPNVDGLDLHNTSLALDARGVPHFDRHTMQAGQAPVFIAGDANADAPLLHEAADEGRIAGENAARYPDVAPGLRRAALGVVFSDPQIALVGTPFARLESGTFVAGEVDFGDQGRSRVMLRNRGMLRVYADIESGRFVGAEMVGPSAEHIGHLLAWAAQQSLTVAQMLEMPFYHPVVEEGLRTALRDAAARLAQARPQRLAA